MQSKTVIVEFTALERIHRVLQSSLDNARELLNLHIQNAGEHPITDKDRRTKSMYEREISELTDLINYTNENII